MNILPKESKEFASKEYWDKFFKQRDNSFEWYGDYTTLKPVLQRYLKYEENLLTVGCGNSSLSADLYDDGYRNNVSIDISDVVIQKMNTRYKSGQMRQSLIFECMDVFNMTYASQSFNVVLDKGTLDALSAESSLDVTKMFIEIDRVLKLFGRYICVSLLQENILIDLLSWFTEAGNWIVRIHRCGVNRNNTKHPDSVNFPVFLVVCTKLKTTLPKSLIEVDCGNNQLQKCQNNSEVNNIVKSMQDIEFFKYFIRNNKIKDDDFYIELFGKQSSLESRYMLYFAQKSSITNVRCCVFIVPQGREHEWLFSTGKGRENLLKQCQCDRLIVVHLSRKHSYRSMEEIKEELSGQVTDLFPLEANHKIAFLSIGDDIGERQVVWSGRSEFSDEMVVEDVTLGKVTYRRLVFLHNRNIIQSEAKLKSILTKKKKSQIVIDHGYLSCDHHQVIAAGLSLMNQPTKNSYNLMVVGLGGGCLINFLVHNLRSDVSLRVVIVEIDSVMYDIAKRFFEFGQFNRPNISIEVVIQDGLEFIHQKSKNEQFDFIIFDVDSKNTNQGISCPPHEFVEESFLSEVHSCVASDGIFILNLVARNEDIKQVVYQRLNKQFAKCLKSQVEDDLNEILFCFNSSELTWLQLVDSQQRHKFVLNSCFHIDILSEAYNSLCKRKPLLLNK